MRKLWERFASELSRDSVVELQSAPKITAAAFWLIYLAVLSFVIMAICHYFSTTLGLVFFALGITSLFLSFSLSLISGISHGLIIGLYGYRIIIDKTNSSKFGTGLHLFWNLIFLIIAIGSFYYFFT